MEHTYNEIEIFNDGWVHIDGKNPDVCKMTVETYDIVCAGQIFLTPSPDVDSGVGIYKLNDNINWTEQELFTKTIDEYTLPKENYLAGKISLDEYKSLHKEYHDNFIQTSFVSNQFNRMISWKGMSLHGSKMGSMERRLNQYFFIYKM
jgi:hypothetical protein